MNIIDDGNITSVPGFKAAGIHCGIKKKGKDLALIVSDVPAVSTGVFTTNKVKAAPVQLSRKLLKKGKTKAIIINSGNANAFTGDEGYENSDRIVKEVAGNLQIPYDQVLIASTGVIGENLPMNKIKLGILKLLENISITGGKDASEAILTTDTNSKSIAVEFEMDNKLITVGGIAKGSGMIYPDMATMLSFITTNIVIDKKELYQALKNSVEISYNMITVDGDRSTNDSVFCLANGLAGNKPIIKGKRMKQFVDALNYVNSALAKMIIKDGEGATKFIEVNVRGTRIFSDAKSIAFSVANSNLVKTAFFGEDPNWGRIVSSAGATSLKNTYDFDKISIWFDNNQIIKDGKKTESYNGRNMKNILKQKEIKLTLDLGEGNSQATVWTSDLSYDYIKINSEYST